MPLAEFYLAVLGPTPGDMSFPTSTQCEAIQLVDFSREAERMGSIKNGPSPVRHEVGDHPTSGQDQLSGKLVGGVD